MFRYDICIAGAGIIGLSLALELESKGLSVVVLETGRPMEEASTAAAGMLAAEDPYNPAELAPLSGLSISLYPAFLDRVASLSGMIVPFQTSWTLQLMDDMAVIEDGLLKRVLLKRGSEEEPSIASHFKFLDERSIDPRQLASSLQAAVAATAIDVFSNRHVLETKAELKSVRVLTAARTIEAAHFIDCTGAWAGDPAYSVFPIKGQMLAIALPDDFPLKMTVRGHEIYIVPRTVGPRAGRAIIGATLEDVGFDMVVHGDQIEALHRRASVLLPPLAHAPVLESWSGLRPATADRLPILGAHPAEPRQWIATGHYRNGILLAPATAHVMTQMILGGSATVALDAFSPSRAAVRTTLCPTS